ncbi:uncharacterized protein LOC113309427 [Papaver somniferum]|uniref:uncharacterized protein LOC113309427 n=1 Tax=Papaver somniferum TaxID=3469 RepID=UPI000E6F8AE4|nr:uncharacterized protein LOC113309427 [Papaver somniferum]XP_026413644.1 uncharacterized protein LOC113309427 [Papaver somniferum]
MFVPCVVTCNLGHLIENCPVLHEFRQYKAHQVAGVCQMQDNHPYPQTCNINPCYNDDNELNFENSMFSPTHATDSENEPNIEVKEGTRNTTILNREMHFCYDDDDYDVMLEEHVYAENIVEPLGSGTLGFSASTFMNDVSSSATYTCDVNTDLGPVQLTCEKEHDTHLVSDIGNVESSVDTNDLMHENIIDVSDSLPRSQYDVSFDLPMHENKVLNDADDSELWFVNLSNDCEHDRALFVSALGKTRLRSDIFEPKIECNLNASDSLPRTQCVAPSDSLMNDTKVLDDDDYELGLDELFYENEHDMHVFDFRRVCVGTNDFVHENNLDIPTSLPMSQTGNLPTNLDLVCNKIVKPTLLRIPNLGLELCASQVLLDYFSDKYNVFKKPQLECAHVSLDVPNTVHFELDLVHDEPLKLQDFVYKSVSVVKSRFEVAHLVLQSHLHFCPIIIV